MPIPFVPLTPETAASFGEAFGKHGAGLSWNMAEGMTCTEVEAFAALLVELGYPEGAQSWIDVHSASDEPGDMHYEGGAA